MTYTLFLTNTKLIQARREVIFRHLRHSYRVLKTILPRRKHFLGVPPSKSYINEKIGSCYKKLGYPSKKMKKKDILTDQNILEFCLNDD
jgi:hypothetical protein